jgi:hypothetical protein
LQTIRQTKAKLPEQGFLLCRRVGNAAQADFATGGGGKNDGRRSSCFIRLRGVALQRRGQKSLKTADIVTNLG